MKFAEHQPGLQGSAEKGNSPQGHQGTEFPKGWFAWFLDKRFLVSL